MRPGRGPSVHAYDQDDRVHSAKDGSSSSTIKSIRPPVRSNSKPSFRTRISNFGPASSSVWLRLDRRRGPIVPEAVVQYGPDGNYALVIRPDDTVELRPLRIAASHQGEALVATGLAAGKRVVVDGRYRLQRGIGVVVAVPQSSHWPRRIAAAAEPEVIRAMNIWTPSSFRQSRPRC